jgi:Raf kinase inhibitor-like YbhB/YbcL family protein
MQMHSQRFLMAGLFLLGAVACFASAQQAPPARPPSLFKLTSPAYGEGSQIPKQFSCLATPTYPDSNSVSPPLQWSNPPKGTASFAIIFHDAEGASNKGTMDTTHWILWNIPGTATELPQSVPPGSSPDGIQQGQNVRKTNGYEGPCPPPGSTPHHYIFEMYALDQKLDLAAGSSRVDLLKAMEGHIIGKAVFVGLFGR